MYLEWTYMITSHLPNWAVSEKLVYIPYECGGTIRIWIRCHISCVTN
jgi:hypothetical protein